MLKFSPLQSRKPLLKTITWVSTPLLLAVIALGVFSPSAQASWVGQLSPIQIATKINPIQIEGDHGNYEIKMVINSSPKRIWTVITNYKDLPRFIPDIVSSKVTENKGNQKVIEQIYLAPYTFGIKSKIKVQVTESFPQGLDIKLLKADYLNTFQGNWQIKAKNPKQTMLTYTIKIDPKIGFLKEEFYQKYEQQLAENMMLLKKEIEARP